MVAVQATKTPSDIEGDLSPEEVRWEYIKMGGRACNGQSQAGQQINQVIAAHMQKLEQVSVSLPEHFRSLFSLFFTTRELSISLAPTNVSACVCVCVSLCVRAHAWMCVMVCC